MWCTGLVVLWPACEIFPDQGSILCPSAGGFFTTGSLGKSLYHFLDSAFKYYLMIFVFILFTSTSMIISRSIHVAANGIIFIFLDSKITADGDCSHEIKRHLLLGRKVITNLDSIFKSRDITLPTKVHLVKAMVFPVVMYGCESWTVKKAEH